LRVIGLLKAPGEVCGIMAVFPVICRHKQVRVRVLGWEPAIVGCGIEKERSTRVPPNRRHKVTAAIIPLETQNVCTEIVLVRYVEGRRDQAGIVTGEP
jgi:hypothetical protein